LEILECFYIPNEHFYKGECPKFQNFLVMGQSKRFIVSKKRKKNLGKLEFN
jgi:hypothetical protein